MNKYNIGDTLYVVDINNPEYGYEVGTITVEEISSSHGYIRYNGIHEECLFLSKKDAQMSLKSLLERKMEECRNKWQSYIVTIDKQIALSKE